MTVESAILEHYTRWEEVAVVSEREWLRHSADIFQYLIPGEVGAPHTEGGSRSSDLGIELTYVWAVDGV
jgi:hypothetical protein